MCERGRGEAAERRRRCVRALSRLGDLLSWVPGLCPVRLCVSAPCRAEAIIR